MAAGHSPAGREQEAIVEVVSAYDDLIENNRRRIALLEEAARMLYREWFVRLRFPGHEKVRTVKGVPETWDNTRFGKFCMLKRGYDLPDRNVEPGEYPVIASTSITTYHNEDRRRYNDLARGNQPVSIVRIVSSWIL